MAAADGPPSSDNEGQGLINLGNSFTDRGDYQSAEIAYERILGGGAFSVSDRQAALLGLGRTFRKSGNLTKAAALYERFIKDYPTDDRLPDAYLELGRTLRAMGANKLALNRFYSVINSTLKLPQTGFEHYQSLARTAEYEIAETFYEDGDYGRASAYFSRLQLLSLSPADRARASFMAARSAILAEDLENGCRALHAFLENWPEDSNAPEARYLLASSLRKIGRPQEALAVVLDLLRQEQHRAHGDPKVWEYWQRRAGNLLANDFFQSGDTLSALAIYQGMASLGTEAEWQLPVLYQIGLCYERLFDFEGAVASYRKVIAIADAEKANPKGDSAELGRMAAWRINHVEWLQNTNTKLALFADVLGKDGKDMPRIAVPKAAEPISP